MLLLLKERFKFGYSWRDDILNDHWEQRPQVAALLDTSWSDFSATSHSEIEKAAAVQAMAAVFIRYLDDKGKLSDVYYAVRDQHLSPDLSAYRSYQDIVAEQLGMHVNDLDRDFAQWFKRQQAAQERTSATEPGSEACRFSKSHLSMRRPYFGQCATVYE